MHRQVKIDLVTFLEIHRLITQYNALGGDLPLSEVIYTLNQIKDEIEGKFERIEAREKYISQNNLDGGKKS